MLSGKNIAVLGVGTLGTALVSGLLESGTVSPDQIRGTVGHSETIKSVEQQLDFIGIQGIKISTDNTAAVKGADIVILSLNPKI